MSEEERQKMLPEPEIDKDIDEAAPIIISTRFIQTI